MILVLRDVSSVTPRHLYLDWCQEFFLANHNIVIVCLIVRKQSMSNVFLLNSSEWTLSESQLCVSLLLFVTVNCIFTLLTSKAGYCFGGIVSVCLCLYVCLHKKLPIKNCYELLGIFIITHSAPRKDYILVTFDLDCGLWEHKLLQVLCLPDTQFN